MPKTKPDPETVIQEFGGQDIWEYNRQKKSVLCRLCIVSFDIGRKSHLRQHLESSKHKKSLESHKEGKNPKQQSLQFPSTSEEDTPNEFARDLCTAFVGANISLSKVESPAVVDFLKKYVKERIPSD